MFYFSVFTEKYFVVYDDDTHVSVGEPTLEDLYQFNLFNT